MFLIRHTDFMIVPVYHYLQILAEKWVYLIKKFRYWYILKTIFLRVQAWQVCGSSRDAGVVQSPAGQTSPVRQLYCSGRDSLSLPWIRIPFPDLHQRYIYRYCAFLYSPLNYSGGKMDRGLKPKIDIYILSHNLTFSGQQIFCSTPREIISSKWLQHFELKSVEVLSIPWSAKNYQRSQSFQFFLQRNFFFSLFMLTLNAKKPITLWFWNSLNCLDISNR